MTNRFTIAALSALLILGTACNPRRKLEKYSYLLDDDQKSDDNKPGEVTVKTDPEEDDKGKRLSRKDVKGLLAFAEKQIGSPYKSGATGPRTYDCSGFVLTSYKNIDVSLPRTSRDQSLQGKKVNRSKLVPGDLVFFASGKPGKINHVGIVYEVKGKDVSFIHASTSKGVRIDKLNVGWWKDRYVTARRVL